jgi:hypothetical protein
MSTNKDIHYGNNDYSRLLLRRIAKAIKNREKWFDFDGDTYVKEGKTFIPWWQMRIAGQARVK